MKTLILIVGLLFFFGQSFSQSHNTYERSSEFEAQRFLMNEIYEISSTQIDQFRIDFTFKEIDPEGFILRLTSYEFNGEFGVIITALNTYDVVGDLYKFKNIHLSKKEYEDLNMKFTFLEMNLEDKKTNLLQRFDDSFIFEVTSNPSNGSISYNLWIENENRHNIEKGDWVSTYKRFPEFVQQ